MFIHFLLAMLPIIWLIIALSGLKMAGHVACPIALIICNGNLANLSGYRGSSVYLQLGRTYEKHGTY